MKSRRRTDFARRGYGKMGRAPTSLGQSQIVSCRIDANWSRFPSAGSGRWDSPPFLTFGLPLGSDGCAREGCSDENELRFFRLLQESLGFPDRADLRTSPT